jgi:hypothetical protein
MNLQSQNSLLLIILIALAETVFAEESRTEADYKTYVLGLPKCDKVEVLRLGKTAGELVKKESINGVQGYKRVLPEDKSNLYHIEPHTEWRVISEKRMLPGEQAKKLIGLYRLLKPWEPYTESLEEGLGLGHGVPFCHSPQLAYRFYDGEKLVFHTSICWSCQNLTVGTDEKRRYFYFNYRAKEANELLSESAKLFPQNPISELPYDGKLDAVLDIPKKAAEADSNQEKLKSKETRLLTGTDGGGALLSFFDSKTLKKTIATIGLSNKRVEWLFYYESGEPYLFIEKTDYFAWDETRETMDESKTSHSTEVLYYLFKKEIIKRIGRPQEESISLMADSKNESEIYRMSDFFYQTAIKGEEVIDAELFLKGDK